MSYEQDRTLPLPPLREVRIEADPSDVEPAISETRIADKNTISQPSEVEKYSTRAGGSDPQPELPALREVHIDRESDVCKSSETPTGKDEGSRVQKKSAFASIATWTIIAVFAFWISCQLLPLLSFVFRYSLHDWRFYANGVLFLIPFALLLFVSCRVYLLLSLMFCLKEIRGRAL